MLRRNLLASFALTSMFVLPASGQDGPLRKAGRALDNAGKNARARAENGIDADEDHDVAARVHQHLRWDKRLSGAVLQVEMLGEGEVSLKGSVPDQAARERAVDLVSNTHGVASVQDELVVGREVRVVKDGKPVPVPKASIPVLVRGGAKVVVPRR